MSAQGDRVKDREWFEERETFGDKAAFLGASLGVEECSNVVTRLHCFRDASNHRGCRDRAKMSIVTQRCIQVALKDRHITVFI